MQRDGSGRKLAVEIPVISDPHPDPIFATSQSDGPVVEGHAHRPSPRITAESFHVEPGMGLVLAKENEGLAGGGFDLGRQSGVESPKAFRAARSHNRRLSSSRSSRGNAVGPRRLLHQLRPTSGTRRGGGDGPVRFAPTRPRRPIPGKVSAGPWPSGSAPVRVERESRPQSVQPWT